MSTGVNEFLSAYEVPALSLDDAVGVFGGTTSPETFFSGASEPPPDGSRYFRTDGASYVLMSGVWFELPRWAQLPHGFPLPYEVTLSYSAVNRQVTITPTSSAFVVYVKGKKFTLTGTQVSTAHANTTGKHYVYYDTAGVLTTSTTAWDVGEVAPVCYIYYNATLVDAFAQFELHTAYVDKQWHKYAHSTVGTLVSSGFEITGYTINTDTSAAVTFALAIGVIWDEDIRFPVTVSLPDNGPYVIARNTGTTPTVTWTSENLPYLVGTTYLQYNQNNAGTWQMTELVTSDYVNYWVAVTTAIDTAKQMFLIPGQEKFTALSSAQAETPIGIVFSALTEWVIVWKITFQVKSSYNGVTGKARIVEVTRVTASRNQISSGFSPGAHNTLSLRDAADCHPAAAITNTPAGAITATDVQAALNALDVRIAALGG